MVVGVEPVVIPQLRQGPDLLDGQRFTARHAVLGAPRVDRVFRPEEQDGGSGEYEVVVPAAERQRKMDQFAVAVQLAVAYCQVDRTTVGEGVDLSVGV